MESMNQQDRDLLIRLDTKLDNLRNELSEIKGMLTSHDSRIREVEINGTHCETELDGIKIEMNRLKTNTNLRDGLIAVGTIIAAVVAYTFGR